MEIAISNTINSEQASGPNYEGVHPSLRKDAILNKNMYSSGKIGDAAYTIAEEKLMAHLSDDLQIFQVMGFAASTIIAIENSAGGMAVNSKYSLSSAYGHRSFTYNYITKLSKCGQGSTE